MVANFYQTILAQAVIHEGLTLTAAMLRVFCVLTAFVGVFGVDPNVGILMPPPGTGCCTSRRFGRQDSGGHMCLVRPNQKRGGCYQHEQNNKKTNKWVWLEGLPEEAEFL